MPHRYSKQTLLALGITSGRLPFEGMPPRQIDGVWVWVTPFVGRALARTLYSKSHRVMCSCPKCDIVMSYGRLDQHLKGHEE